MKFGNGHMEVLIEPVWVLTQLLYLAMKLTSQSVASSLIHWVYPPQSSVCYGLVRVKNKL